MAKEKLFPAPDKATDKREPHERFADFAAKIVNVSKDEIDKREAKWRQKRRKR